MPREFLPEMIDTLAGKLSRQLHTRYKEIHSLNIAEWRVLFHLDRHSNANAKDLVEMVNLHKSRVSRTCNRLHQAGLIHHVKCPIDARKSQYSLTSQGKNLIRDLKPVANSYNDQLNKLLGKDTSKFLQCLKLLQTHE